MRHHRNPAPPTLFVAFPAAAQRRAANPASNSPGAAEKSPQARGLARFYPACASRNLRAKAPDVYEGPVRYDCRRNSCNQVTRSWGAQWRRQFYNLVLHHFYDWGRFFPRTAKFHGAVRSLAPIPKFLRVGPRPTLRRSPLSEQPRGFINYAMAGPNTGPRK